MGNYKDKNGTTRVGDFLRKLAKGDALKVVGSLVSGDIQGAIKAITNDTTMTEAEREHALKVMQLDIQEMESVTRRWESDNNADSFLTKNIRPLSLVFLTVTTVLLIFLDSFDATISVPSEWVELLKSLLLGIYIAYFGSRGLEKYRSIK